jgi:choline/glycine/proline betaine transport protein
MKRNPFWIGCEWTGFTSAITIIIIIALTLMFTRGRRGFTATQNFVANKAGWFFILSVNIF